MKTNPVYSFLLWFFSRFTAQAGAIAHPKHFDTHKTEATHECAKHCAEHPGIKYQACAVLCLTGTSGKAHACDTPDPVLDFFREKFFIYSPCIASPVLD